MTNAPSARDRRPHRWWPGVLVAAVIYPAIGIGFAFLDDTSAPAGVRFWRLAAWAVSAGVLVAHLHYELRRPVTRALSAAWHLSLAVALGAFLLAIWVLVHGRTSGAAQSPLAPLALVLFPLITAVPAFVAALAAGAVVRRLGPRQKPAP